MSDAGADLATSARGLTRTPPSNLEAEQAVLGACLLRRDAVLECQEIGLIGQHFYRPAHEAIWDALSRLRGRGEPTDPIMVASELGPDLERHGGRGYLHTLLAGTPSGWNGVHWGRLVIRQAALRGLVSAGQKIIQLGYDDGEDLDAILAAATLEVTRVADGSFVRDEDSLDEIADRAMTMLETGEPYVPTPWAALNEFIDGVRAARFGVVAGRPATGKTMLLLQWALAYARHARRTDGAGVAYLTMEMGAPRLYQRALAQSAAVPAKRIRTGDLTDANWIALTTADRELRSLPLALIGASGWTAPAIRAKARALARKRPLGLLVVDHIGLVPGVPGSRDGRQMELSHAADDLLRLAHELQCCVIVASQLNRNPLGRANQLPTLGDIRDTDRLQQHADWALLLHRDPDEDPRNLWVNLAKHRDGEEGVFHLDFDGALSRVLTPGERVA